MKTKLICIPYAGGTGMTYLKWKKYLSSNYELVPIDLPGRGKRISESFLNSIEEVVDDIIAQIDKMIEDKFSYALYGHSMGTLIIYELMHQMMQRNYPMPIHVFLSGRNPPMYGVDRIISTMKDVDFFEEISKYGGTPAEFFQHKELVNIFLPILKSDYHLVESYKFKRNVNKIPSNITFFFSTEDPGIQLSKVKEWQSLILGNMTIYQYNGGHFFINDQCESMLKQLMLDMSCYENLRKNILKLLKEKCMTAAEIASQLDIPEDNLSPQFRILKFKDLILEDKPNLYSLNTSVFDELSMWMSKNNYSKS